MKKIALVFVIAVFLPSLVLAWLAVRSLRDQQLILERQQFLLYQSVADSLAANADNFVEAQQHEFGRQVENLIANRQPSEIAATFDNRLRSAWPMAEVGFVVTVGGNMLCPADLTSCTPASRTFYNENSKFVCSIQPAEVYWNAGRAGIGNNYEKQSPSANQAFNPNSSGNQIGYDSSRNSVGLPRDKQGFQFQNNAAANQANAGVQADTDLLQKNSSWNLKSVVTPKRNVLVQQSSAATPAENDNAQYSKVAASEAEFRQLVGDSTEGSVARFLENKLNVLLWYRSTHDPSIIFGAKLALPRLKGGLAPLLQQLEPALREDIVVALLDDTAKPVALSRPRFQASWKRPFAATEVGEALPHWEMAVYILDPAKLAKSAHTLALTLGLLIAVLILAISVGAWLIFSDLNRHLTLARQKTDFVSNVSHELKTPLTSIRMFSELLAEGRVTDDRKRQSYLNIITAETGRLTRLINNVLDFSRLERGEKKYNFATCDLVDLVRETVATYRPHLEANGFTIACQLPDSPIMLQGDRDALAQIVVNLLSNAEKYSNGQKEIAVQIEQLHEPLPHVEVRILDRGPGVPKGCEEKIFEQFYRAHDSLSSGIQGSGLGLTLARQIARAHAGDVIYHPREGGGSSFTLRLPTPPQQPK